MFSPTHAWKSTEISKGWLIFGTGVQVLFMELGTDGLVLRGVWSCFSNISFRLPKMSFDLKKFETEGEIEDKRRKRQEEWEKVRKPDDPVGKNCKNLDHGKSGCNHSKIWTRWLFHRVMHPKHADGMTNNVNPDWTAPGAVWSGSKLFGQTCLPEKLGQVTRLCPVDCSRKNAWNSIKKKQI